MQAAYSNQLKTVQFTHNCLAHYIKSRKYFITLLYRKCSLNLPLLHILHLLSHYIGKRRVPSSTAREQGIRSSTAKKKQVTTENLYWLASPHGSLKIYVSLKFCLSVVHSFSRTPAPLKDVKNGQRIQHGSRYTRSLLHVLAGKKNSLLGFSLKKKAHPFHTVNNTPSFLGS